MSRCPRCGGAFHCGAADPMPCACSSLELGAELLLRLRERYAGCLCLHCLQALAPARSEAGAATEPCGIGPGADPGLGADPGPGTGSGMCPGTAGPA